MSEITGVSMGNRIASKPKVSMEGVQSKKEIAASLEIKELKQFELDMQRAILLADEIRHSLEQALKDL